MARGKPEQQRDPVSGTVTYTITEMDPDNKGQTREKKVVKTVKEQATERAANLCRFAQQWSIDKEFVILQIENQWEMVKEDSAKAEAAKKAALAKQLPTDLLAKLASMSPEALAALLAK